MLVHKGDTKPYLIKLEDAMDEKPTRAQRMAEQYGEVLKKHDPMSTLSRIIKSEDKQTPEQKEKLKKAMEKLATFKDLIT